MSGTVAQLLLWERRNYQRHDNASQRPGCLTQGPAISVALLSWSGGGKGSLGSVRCAGAEEHEPWEAAVSQKSTETFEKNKKKKENNNKNKTPLCGCQENFLTKMVKNNFSSAFAYF